LRAVTLEADLAGAKAAAEARSEAMTTDFIVGFVLDKLWEGGGRIKTNLVDFIPQALDDCSPKILLDFSTYFEVYLFFL
jgi:hypothetical protein